MSTVPVGPDGVLEPEAVGLEAADLEAADPEATDPDMRQLPDLSRQVLLVRAGGERLGLVVEETAAVIEPSRLSLVPKAPPGVLGIMNHVGSILTVVSLATLLGRDGAAADPAEGGVPLVVVVERGGDRIGLVVDRIEEITLTVDLAGDVRPDRARADGDVGAAGGEAPGSGERPFTRGWLSYGGTPVRVLDGGALLEEVFARFGQRA